MKKVEHGKTFDRNAANPPAFETEITMDTSELTRRRLKSFTTP